MEIRQMAGQFTKQFKFTIGCCKINIKAKLLGGKENAFIEQETTI
ncbi:MAG: hypothetical protein ACYDIA_06465 [Candidatus Humimicrobiaceae bacterium]